MRGRSRAARRRGAGFAWRALWRNAHPNAAALDEAQPAMLVARQADARGHDDVRRPPAHRFEPQEATRREVDARQPAADAERRAEAAWTARQVPIAHAGPVRAHALDAFERFE